VTRAEERRPPPPDYPWRAATPPAPVADHQAAVTGHRAGLVTRALANVADLVVVALLLGAGWVAVAAGRYLVHPTGFRLPAPSTTTLLLVGLGVQAVYFAATWALIGGTYGDRLLGLRVTGRRGGRLHCGLSAVRAVLCTLVPIGLLWVLVSGENRSVQDLLLRTSVVYD
jgi:uncharacterized RDD family membrane protein YckC